MIRQWWKAAVGVTARERFRMGPADWGGLKPDRLGDFPHRPGLRTRRMGLRWRDPSMSMGSQVSTPMGHMHEHWRHSVSVWHIPWGAKQEVLKTHEGIGGPLTVASHGKERVKAVCKPPA